MTYRCCLWLLVLVLGGSSLALGQEVSLYTEDFESGGVGWTKTDLWYVTAAPNVCGTMPTKAAEFNDPATCTYFVSATPHTGDLISPASGVLLSNSNPKLNFQYKLTLDSQAQDTIEVAIRDAGNGSWTPLAASTWNNSGTLELKKLVIPTGWVGHTVQFRFRFIADGARDNTFGWVIDNVQVTSDPPPPTVSSVLPNHGPTIPGMSGVVITGTSFTSTTSVFFGPSPVASFFVIDDSHLSVDLDPTVTVGFVDVIVSNAGGTGSLAHAYDYFVPPTQIGVPCAGPYLTWQGSPTLGQTFTTVTQNLGGEYQWILIDWSNQHGGTGTVFPVPTSCSAAACQRYTHADSVYSLGNNNTLTLAIPNSANLIGVHFRLQAFVGVCPRLSTQALDAVIGR